MLLFRIRNKNLLVGFELGPTEKRFKILVFYLKKFYLILLFKIALQSTYSIYSEEKDVSTADEHCYGPEIKGK